MKIVRVFYILFALTFCGSLIGLIYLKQIGVLNNNELKVSVDETIRIKDLKIYQGYFTMNRENDSELFKNESKTLVNNGHKIKNIRSDHGKNDFLITYKDSLYFQFRYLKTNNRMIDKFLLDLWSQNDSIYLKVNIKGTNRLQFVRPLNSIADSKYLKTNIPIDETGIIYNGMELIKKEKTLPNKPQ